MHGLIHIKLVTLGIGMSRPVAFKSGILAGMQTLLLATRHLYRNKG